MLNGALLSLGAAARFGGAALVEASGATTTWSTLATEAARMGASLRRETARSGLGPDDLVTFVARPSRATFVLMHALIALGRAFLPLHPRLVANEIEPLLAALGPAHRLTDDWIAEAADDAQRHRAELSAGPEIPDDERPLAVLASSGTTGVPKGVVLSRRAFAASAVASHANLPLRPGHRWVSCMPWAHAGGLSILTRTLVARAGVIVLPRFEATSVGDAIEAFGATHVSVVPTMLHDLVAGPDPRGARFARLDVALVGGAACPVELLAEARQRGLAAIATYGLTEACSQVTTQPLGDRARVPDGDSGHALGGTEIAILRHDADDVASEGEAGRIAIRGPSLFSGYRGGPARSADAWFDTGDQGQVRPDGRLVVLGRRSDLIVTGGENAYPAEIERAIEQVHGVRACAVVGVPDARWGEVVAVVLELEPDTQLTSVVGALASRLAPHKRPRRATVAAEALPRTAKGEVDRVAVRRRYTEALRSASAIA